MLTTLLHCSRQKRWFKFEATDAASDVKMKRDIIQSYMESKINASDFVNTTSKLINDYIQYGNCFATVEFQRKVTNFEDGDRVVNYVGPKHCPYLPLRHLL